MGLCGCQRRNNLSARVFHRRTYGSSRRRRGGAGAPRVVEQLFAPAKEAEARGAVELPRNISVKELADLLSVSAIEVIKELMKNGILANITQTVDYEAATLVAKGLGFEVTEAPKPSIEAPRVTVKIPHLEGEGANLRPRPPVVTIMGHVDHGKTKLLDAIRQTNVVATEAGGITQHIGAYQVEIKGQKITFLDTPGHEAFTAMRARGAQVTDIAVLVVAADDGVMPQTIEAIDHAKAAGVPIVVAINKVDKPDANPERVKQQLADHSLVIEEWGGDVIAVPVSAKTKQGVPELLENLLVVAEVAELKANPQGAARGAVIEAQMDSTRGPMATLLVQEGTLNLSDVIVAGAAWGKVKALFNDRGKRLRRAGPAMPVEVLGFGGLPLAGDVFNVVVDERGARAIVEQRQGARRAEAMAGRSLNLDVVSAQIREGKVKQLNLVIKTDVQGSIEPIRASLEQLDAGTVKINVIHAASGSITESDVMLALASNGVIIGFNSRPESGAKNLADAEGVDIRFYDVIYNLVEDIKKAAAGMLEPTYVEVVEGHGEVRVVFSIAKKGKVGGSYVTDGKLSRGAMARVIRGGQVVSQSQIVSLHHFKEDVREMAAGFECGVLLEGFNDFKEGDIIEAYRKERANAPS
ncbi:MAG: translation initiation factor IF-2 [Chloroflexi bacterium]|nr:translation initiation factor IF-2 [Chloroflexota bacterium]